MCPNLHAKDPNGRWQGGERGGKDLVGGGRGLMVVFEGFVPQYMMLPFPVLYCSQKPGNGLHRVL